jgi:diamine N-acetyltransferase
VQGATVLKVSGHDGDGSPAPFYLSLGFVPTGEMAGDDEPVYALTL